MAVITVPPSTATAAREPTATATPTPPPTPPCVQPTLSVSQALLRIVSVQRAADGSLPVIPNQSDTAFWVEGTTRQYVFALSPTAGNLALRNSLKKGDVIKIQWGDCSSENFEVSTITTDKPDPAQLLDQSLSGLKVVILSPAPEQSLVIAAGRPQPQAAATPEPTEVNAIQAELSFLGQQTTPDGKSLVLSVALKNTGSSPIVLTNKDVSLGIENSTPSAPSAVTPTLPQTIASGASLTIQLTFPKPEGHAAVLRLLTFAADLYY